MSTFIENIKRRWNAFRNNRDPTQDLIYKGAPNYGGGDYIRPDRYHYSVSNARSIVNSILNRIAIDCASIEIQHVRIDEMGRVVDVINDGIHQVLNVDANIDQDGRAFRQDMFASLLDEGCMAIVITDADSDPRITDSYGIKEVRIGKILNWYPDAVKIDVYNEIKGKHEDVILPKRMVAIVENPFYSVMNEPNSTLKRLIRKMNILDAIDEQSGAGKLDLIIQLPYTLKSELKKNQAEERRKEIELQLADSKYGIAYIDSTEHITQLNRPLDNNLMKQIEYLTEQLMAQLSITQEIMNGTADENAMTNYYSRTIEPIVSAAVGEMHRKFLSKTARSQGQAIRMFQNPFRLIPVNQIADISDKLTRNEILSANEVRGLIGFRPVNDPLADQLKNANINASEGQRFAVANDNVKVDDATLGIYNDNIQKGGKE